MLYLKDKVEKKYNITVLGLVGDTGSIDTDMPEGLEIVEKVQRISEPFKKANRKFHEEDTVILGDGFAFIGGHPMASEHRGFSAGSFRDMARVAKVNLPMWTELFMENADFLAEELDIMIQNLVLYKKALEERDEATLAALLEEGAIRKGEPESI